VSVEILDGISDWANFVYSKSSVYCDTIIIIIIIGNLGRKISSSSGDDREGAFLFQRVSVLVQRFNAV